MNKMTRKLILCTVACMALWACQTSTTAPTAGVSVELQNPVLPGFHPDPSVVAVGEDYYLVNSSFHYFPGVPIFHSRDLQNWEQIGNVLDRPSQLPLKSATSWLGIYAPTIRYNDGTYYMITTLVGEVEDAARSAANGNFMVTATNPAGPWSEPIYLEQQGIDPSLYFEDGKCYMVSNPDGVITLCEIDPATGTTLSPGKELWRGTGGRFPEGPHVYKKDGWYYLLISEGGTEMAHKLTVARSKNIYGPYESNPANPIFTHCSAAAQNSNIQGTGHGDLFQAADGSWWIVMLAYRRFGGDFHHLGRETFLAPVTWENDWPVINGGKPLAEKMTVRMPSAPKAVPSRDRHYTFSEAPGPEWMHVQAPVYSNYAFTKDGLVLHGNGESLGWGSEHPTALLRRQEAAEVTLSTTVKLHGNADAGLAVYQIFSGYATLGLCRSDLRLEAVLRYQVRSIDKEVRTQLPLWESSACLEIRAYGDHYEFWVNGRELGRLDSALLSTEVVGGFTGVTMGPYCTKGMASFPELRYLERIENE